MKKKLLLLGLVAASAIGAYPLWQQYSRQQAQAERIERNAEYVEEEAQEWAGARDYLWRRKANPTTNAIDPADVFNARKKTMQKAAERAGELNWEFLGPNDVGGRTRTIIVDRNNSNHLLAASVAGGIFVSYDGGLNWSDHPQNTQEVNGQPMFESMAFSCGVQDPTNGDIYLGTGEGFYYYFGQGAGGVPGEGIYKSTDGGQTFRLLPSTRPSNANNANDGWASINKITVAPDGTIYAGTGGTGGTLKVSEDGGETWTTVPGVTGQGFDVVVASNGTVHAFAGGSYYRSTDGNTFTMMSGTQTGKLPNSGARRRLAVSPTNPNKVYAVYVLSNECTDKVYSTDNGGDFWYVIGDGDENFFEPMGNSVQCQGGYDLAIAVDPNNENRIFLAGVTLWSWSSTDNWMQIDNLFEDASNPYYIHSDKHDVVFDPNNPNRMYVVSDGGVSVSNNPHLPQPTFKTMNKNYNITQFYSVAASLEGRVLGGTQDNGTQYVRFNGINAMLSANEVNGGDGGYAEISHINSNVMFVGNPNGALYRSANAGDGFVVPFDETIDCQPMVGTPPACSGDGAIDGGAEFVTPFALWEDLVKYQTTNQVDAKLATGSTNGEIYFTKNPLDVGTIPTWINRPNVNLAENNTTNAPYKFSSGGVSCVGFTKDGNTLWAGSDNGKVYRLGSLNTTPTKKEVTVDAGRYVTSVAQGVVSTELIVTLGNYGEADNIYLSTNANTTNPTFTSIQADLPPMPIYDAVALTDDPDKILAATEMGVWMYSRSTETWTPELTNVGNVPVFRIREQAMKTAGCNVLYIGTHGRGMYRCTKYANPDFGCDTTLPSFDATGNNNVMPSALAINVFPNPIHEAANAVVSLPANTTATITIYNLKGQVVRSVNMGKRAAGTHQVPLNFGNLPAGSYFVNLTTSDNQQIVRKVLVQ
jgi:hypothetical protein